MGREDHLHTGAAGSASSQRGGGGVIGGRGGLAGVLGRGMKVMVAVAVLQTGCVLTDMDCLVITAFPAPIILEPRDVIYRGKSIRNLHPSLCSNP